MLCSFDDCQNINLELLKGNLNMILMQWQISAEAGNFDVFKYFLTVFIQKYLGSIQAINYSKVNSSRWKSLEKKKY